MDVPKSLPLRKRKTQLKLKRRLVRKQLQPLLSLVFKAFCPGYETICVLILGGIVSYLQDPAMVIQTASVQTLRRRLHRFLNKYAHTINLLLQLSIEQGTPTTTNLKDHFDRGRQKDLSRLFWPHGRRPTSEHRRRGQVE